MTTNSHPERLSPEEEAALVKLAEPLAGTGFFDMKSGTVDWKTFFADNPELAPPGYDETVAKMEAKYGVPRKQKVGNPNPENISVDSAMQQVNETRRVREEKKKRKGLPPADAFKQPKKRI